MDAAALIRAWSARERGAMMHVQLTPLLFRVPRRHALACALIRARSARDRFFGPSFPHSSDLSGSVGYTAMPLLSFRRANILVRPILVQKRYAFERAPIRAWSARDRVFGTPFSHSLDLSGPLASRPCPPVVGVPTFLYSRSHLPSPCRGGMLLDRLSLGHGSS